MIEFAILSILKAMGISLGVGASTVVITQFIASLQDQVISSDERRLLGINYIILRLAMVLIFFSQAGLLLQQYLYGNTILFDDRALIGWALLAILYVNAILMTAKIMPSTYGPAIQAATWFSLGFLQAIPLIFAIDIHVFTLTYILFTIFAIWLVDLAKEVFREGQPEKG